jgi:hypothetical protein
VRLTARGHITVTASGATAAYTLDPDCAEAQVENQSVVVAGVRPCSTTLIVVAGNETRNFQIFVSASQMQLERLRLARLSAEGIQEFGSVGTSFSSDREELETSIEMARSAGDHSTAISLSVANGYAYSPSDRRTVLPRASVRFKGPSSAVTLLDGYVPESPTIVAGSEVRGLHLETRNWFLHGGIASLTNFREYMVEPDPDSIIVAGYRRVLSKRASFMTDVQWISASSRYLSGQSGTVGSMLYRYEIPTRLRFEAEAAAGQGWGLAAPQSIQATAITLTSEFGRPRLILQVSRSLLPVACKVLEVGSACSMRNRAMNCQEEGTA